MVGLVLSAVFGAITFYAGFHFGDSIRVDIAEELDRIKADYEDVANAAGVDATSVKVHVASVVNRIKQLL